LITHLARGHRHPYGLVAASLETREKKAMGDEQRQILVRQCNSDIECCALLKAERYEIYPSYYYTRSAFRKQGHEEIGLSCILLKAVYGAVNPGSLYGDLLEPTGGVRIPFPALNPG
jgi:hypothetical protein